MREGYRIIVYSYDGNVDQEELILVVLCEDSGAHSEGPGHSSTCIQSEINAS